MSTKFFLGGLSSLYIQALYIASFILSNLDPTVVVSFLKSEFCLEHLIVCWIKGRYIYYLKEFTYFNAFNTHFIKVGSINFFKLQKLKTILFLRKTFMNISTFCTLDLFFNIRNTLRLQLLKCMKSIFFFLFFSILMLDLVKAQSFYHLWKLIFSQLHYYKMYFS